MTDRGFKAGLAGAVEAARQQELQQLARQLDFFADPGQAGSAPPDQSVQDAPGEVAKRGRPMGSRNKRTDAASRFYMSQFGDPLARGAQISALPILAEGVLPELAKVLGCERFEAARWWAGIYAATLPFMHQRLSTLTVRPEGSPEGEPVSWTFSEEILELVHTTQDARRQEALDAELEREEQSGE
jgi:hypothetical protein